MSGETAAKPLVMFVDDDPMLLASTRRQIAMRLTECELVFCQSGKEALERAAETVPSIVFSDVRMPEMDGPELLQRIAEQYPDTLRYAWTGQVEASQQDRVNSVAHEVFTKPCSTESLCHTITESLKSLGVKSV